MQIQLNITSHSVEETTDIGRRLGKQLPKGSIVCFEGDLAAGKTTLIKGLVSEAANYPEDDVNSPTFVYLNIYEGTKTVYHFDLYRLKDYEEFLSVGFDDFFQQYGICCIEWGERIKEIIPAESIIINMAHDDGENRRTIKIIFDDENKKIHL